MLFCRNDQDEVNHESKSEKNDKLLQTLPGSFCGRHVICDTFCGSGTDHSTGCAVCDIDSDLSAAPDDAAETFLIGIGLFVLLALDCYSRFFIGNYGHVMGAKMEYDMRAELFGHLQKLSFSFYDDAKVGQLMSRVTADLFDITELLHHGGEYYPVGIKDSGSVCDPAQH